MGEAPGHTGFTGAVAAATRQREIQRQLRYNSARKAVSRQKLALRRRVPPMLEEFATAIAGALIGCWVIGLALQAAAGIEPLYTLGALGLMYSGQATYHKYRLSIDPDYEVPRCRCAGRRHDDTETVLRSDASSIAGVPNSLLSMLFYAAAIALRATGQTAAIVPLAGGAVLVSVYLSYVMVFRIRGVCPTCVTLGALNVLVLLNVAL